MTEERHLVAEPAQIIPADSKSFKSISPNHKGALRKGREGIELLEADHVARPAQANERLFGGSATIKSALDKGTRIVVQLPLMGNVGTVNARNGARTTAQQGRRGTTDAER
jgi:hypothetical protein